MAILKVSLLVLGARLAEDVTIKQQSKKKEEQKVAKCHLMYNVQTVLENLQAF